MSKSEDRVLGLCPVAVEDLRRTQVGSCTVFITQRCYAHGVLASEYTKPILTCVVAAKFLKKRFKEGRGGIALSVRLRENQMLGGPFCTVEQSFIWLDNSFVTKNQQHYTLWVRVASCLSKT